MHPSTFISVILSSLATLAQAQMYGSPGIMSVSSWDGHPPNGTCKNVDTKKGAAIRLPIEWINKGANCGKEMDVYYYVRSPYQSEEVLSEGWGVVVDVCTECQSWEAKVDKGFYGKIFPHGKGDDATWGPVLVFGQMPAS